MHKINDEMAIILFQKRIENTAKYFQNALIFFLLARQVFILHAFLEKKGTTYIMNLICQKKKIYRFLYEFTAFFDVYFDDDLISFEQFRFLLHGDQWHEKVHLDATHR